MDSSQVLIVCIDHLIARVPANFPGSFARNRQIQILGLL